MDIRRWVATSIAVAMLLGSCAAQSQDDATLPRYVGRVITEWLPDGRKMRLIEPFAFISANGVQWDAPADSIVDGASIPRAGWTLVGSPFVGQYRDASVIHDVACQEKKRPWQDVHLSFYEAMLTSGVGKVRAKMMYAAVYHRGPRWEQIERIENATIERVYESVSTPTIDSETSFETEPLPSPPCDSPPCAPPVVLYNAIITHHPAAHRLDDAELDALLQDIEEEDLSLNEIVLYGL